MLAAKARALIDHKDPGKAHDDMNHFCFLMLTKEVPWLLLGIKQPKQNES